MKYRLHNQILHVASIVGLSIGLSTVTSQSAVMIEISEAVGGVTFDVDGSLLPSSLTEDVAWNSPFTEPNWQSASSGTRDYLSAGTTLAYRQVLDNPTDTGILSQDVFVVPGILSGVGYSIGTSHTGDEVALILERSFPGTTVNFSVYFPGTSLSDFDLTDGDFRQVSFDDGLGGRESISWTVTGIPEPRSAFLLGIGMYALKLLRKRDDPLSTTSRRI